MPDKTPKRPPSKPTKIDESRKTPTYKNPPPPPPPKKNK